MGTPFEVVGRRVQLAKLTAFLGGPERPTVVTILDTAGMGKTTLCTAGVDGARDQGWVVLVARPSDAEASLSFAGLSDLFADVGEQALSRATPSPRWRPLRREPLLCDRDRPRAGASGPACRPRTSTCSRGTPRPSDRPGQPPGRADTRCECWRVVPEPPPHRADRRHPARPS